MPLTLRAPSTLPSASTTTSTISPPTLQWLTGPWHVTHSSLPMWRKNHDVVITYTPVPGTSPAQIDDVVTYQPINSSKTKTVHGLDKPFAVPNTSTTSTPESNNEDGLASMAYTWRGKGWLMIASSKWEILGWGEEEGEGAGNSWVVTYFAKTMFTPAGVDFYSRKGKLSEGTVAGIQEALRAMGGEVEKLAGEVFEVGME